MEKKGRSAVDPRLPALRTLINHNLVPTFGDIFKHIPASILARYMKMNYDRMEMLKEEPKKITVEEIDRLSELIGVEMKKVRKMVDQSFKKSL